MLKQKPILLIIDPSLKCPSIEALNCILRIVGELKQFQQFVFTHTEYISPFLNNLRLDTFIQNKNIGAVICLGSLANVTDNLPWVKDLIKDLENYVFSKQVPFLGICFSHQMLATMHGYKVNYLKKRNEIRFRKHHQFRSFQILHPKLSLLATNFKDQDYFSDNLIDLSFKNTIQVTRDWGKPQWDILSTNKDWLLTSKEYRIKKHIEEYSLKMITSHARHEQEICEEGQLSQDEMVLAATSDTCTYEALVHNFKPFFTLQTHPETKHQDGYLLIKNFTYMSSLLF